MRVVIQRVSTAQVTVATETVGAIGPGVLLLLGITRSDTETEVTWLTEKISKLRIFPDDQGQMNRSLIDVSGAALVVSQFTLHARTRQGTRPSFNAAAPPATAEPLYQLFCQTLARRLPSGTVATGRFGAMMQVTLTNDGPVTLILDTENKG